MTRIFAAASTVRRAGRLLAALHERTTASSHVFRLALLLSLLVPGVAATLFGAQSAAASVRSPLLATAARWCATHGSRLASWTGTVPDLPICGPGPEYGGSWAYVDLPGPGGALSTATGATPGFQCVELAERFLAVVYGLAPVPANGSTVAAHYHAAYPATALYVNGSAEAMGHAPQAGDVLSLDLYPGFAGADDGHVAVVVKSSVDPRSGDGTIVLAQENVAAADYLKTINVVDWRLEDPADRANPEFQFPYAEWLHVATIPSLAAAAERWEAMRGTQGIRALMVHDGRPGLWPTAGSSLPTSRVAFLRPHSLVVRLSLAWELVSSAAMGASSPA